EHVESTAGGGGYNDAHQPCGIGLRPRDPRRARQRGRARDEMQKLSAGKFHVALPSQVHKRMRGQRNRATHVQFQLFSECSPADGMSAAAEQETSACPVGSSTIRLPQVCAGTKGAMSPSWTIWPRRRGYASLLALSARLSNPEGTTCRSIFLT